MVGDPAQRGIGILRGGGEALLRCMAIADADEDHAGAPAHVAAERFVGLFVAQHPSAAVEVDDDRVRTRRCRPVEAVG